MSLIRGKNSSLSFWICWILRPSFEGGFKMLSFPQSAHCSSSVWGCVHTKYEHILGERSVRVIILNSRVGWALFSQKIPGALMYWSHWITSLIELFTQKNFSVQNKALEGNGWMNLMCPPPRLHNEPFPNLVQSVLLRHSTLRLISSTAPASASPRWRDYFHVHITFVTVQRIIK